jgi:hypothetical protein
MSKQTLLSFRRSTATEESRCADYGVLSQNEIPHFVRDDNGKLRGYVEELGYA